MLTLTNTGYSNLRLVPGGDEAEFYGFYTMASVILGWLPNLLITVSLLLRDRYHSITTPYSTSNLTLIPSHLDTLTL